MNINKIDQTLLSCASALSCPNYFECIIKAKNFQRLKKYLNNKNIKILNEYLFIDSIHVQVTKQQLFSLTSLASVTKIFAVTSASVLIDVSKKILGVENSQLTGNGVTVGFIDTGISPHADFIIGKNRLKFFKDFLFERQTYYDDNGHGTFVAGVCSGSGALSGGLYSGIAPKSEIVSLKALNSLGEASADKILQAMEWIYLNHKQFDIKVVCMSFGSEPLGYNDPIMSGAEALWREGIVVVAAAGNSGPEYQTIKSPGVSNQIITVGGFEDNRFGDRFETKFFEIADFSSRGPAFKRVKPDLVAPAVDITSCGTDKPYKKLSGTSVATPMIAGLACLLLEKDKTLTPLQIKQILLNSCKPISLNKNFEGYGYPNFTNLL